MVSLSEDSPESPEKRPGSRSALRETLGTKQRVCEWWDSMPWSDKHAHPWHTLVSGSTASRMELGEPGTEADVSARRCHDKGQTGQLVFIPAVCGSRVVSAGGVLRHPLLTSESAHPLLTSESACSCCPSPTCMCRAA